MAHLLSVSRGPSTEYPEVRELELAQILHSGTDRPEPGPAGGDIFFRLHALHRGPMILAWSIKISNAASFESFVIQRRLKSNLTLTFEPHRRSK